MRVLALMVILLSCAAASAQEAAPFQPYAVGPQRQVPAQVYVPIQSYVVGPPQYRVPGPPCRCYPPPRGVWGFGPFIVGYYW